MEIEKLKLHLIQLVLETDNQEVLLKIAEILTHFQQDSELSSEEIAFLEKIEGNLETITQPEIDEELVEELQNREKAMQENPEKNLTINQLQDKITQKYGFQKV